LHTRSTPTLSRNIHVAKSVVDAISDTIGKYPAETGGLLGGPINTLGIIFHFYFDKTAGTSATVFHPDIDAQDRVQNEWGQIGIIPVGIIHSHPVWFRQPSSEDIYIIKKWSSMNPRIQELYTPIVLSQADNRGKLQIDSYGFTKNGDYELVMDTPNWIIIEG